MAAVEEVVDRGREKQAVFAGEALGVGAVAPGFDVAADEVVRVGHAGDAAAGSLDFPDVLLELALTDARGHERALFGFPQGRVGEDLLLDVILPLLDGGGAGDGFGNARHHLGLC